MQSPAANGSGPRSALQQAAPKVVGLLTQIMRDLLGLLALLAVYLDDEATDTVAQGEGAALLGTRLRRIVSIGLGEVVAELEALTREAGRKRKPRKRRS